MSPYAGPTVVILLCAGGACYIAGAIVYALRKPDPWPKVFGFHEIFHTEPWRDTPATWWPSTW